VSRGNIPDPVTSFSIFLPFICFAVAELAGIAQDNMPTATRKIAQAEMECLAGHIFILSKIHGQS
jgi:hypothetical protein